MKVLLILFIEENLDALFDFQNYHWGLYRENWVKPLLKVVLDVLQRPLLHEQVESELLTVQMLLASSLSAIRTNDKLSQIVI